MGHLRTPDLLAMSAYAVMMLGIAWWYAKREKSSDDYFVAGRGARSWMVGVSMIAALFSTVSFLSVPGELISYGPGWMWSLIHIPITLVIVCVLIIPHIMKHKITSGYELLESRFGSRIRKTASLMFIGVRLMWMGFVLLLCGRTVALVTEIPLPWVLAAIGVVTTISTVTGGIRTVLLTDVIQFTIHASGGLMVILYVTYRFGGFTWLTQWNDGAVADLNWPEIKVFSLSAFDRITIIGAMLHGSIWWIATASSDQMMIQRFLCTGSVKAARKSFIQCMAGHAGMTFILWGIAAALLAYFLRFGAEMPDATQGMPGQADQLFPHFIATVLPSGLRGLIIAALFADAMQSLSSGISALGTVLVVDFKSIFARDIVVDSNRSLARRAKIVGLVVGAVAVALSFMIGFIPGRNFLDIAYRLSGFFTVPLFVLFAMAFFYRGATRAGAWAAVIVGFLSGVLFSYWKQIVGSFMPTGDFSVMLILPLSFTLSLTAGLIASVATRRAAVSGPALEPA